MANLDLDAESKQMLNTGEDFAKFRTCNLDEVNLNCKALIDRCTKAVKHVRSQRKSAWRRLVSKEKFEAFSSKLHDLLGTIVAQSSENLSIKDAKQGLELLDLLVSKKHLFKSHSPRFLEILQLLAAALPKLKAGLKVQCLVLKIFSNTLKYFAQSPVYQTAAVAFLEQHQAKRGAVVRDNFKHLLLAKLDFASRYLVATADQRASVAYITLLAASLSVDVGRKARVLPTPMIDSPLSSLVLEVESFASIVRPAIMRAPITLVRQAFSTNGCKAILKALIDDSVRKAWISSLVESKNAELAKEYLLLDGPWLFTQTASPEIEALLTMAVQQKLDVLGAIGYLVKKVMPTSNFRMVDYDKSIDEISEPLAGGYGKQFILRGRQIFTYTDQSKEAAFVFGTPKPTPEQEQFLTSNLSGLIQPGEYSMSIYSQGVNQVYGAAKYLPTGMQITSIRALDGSLRPRICYQGVNQNFNIIQSEHKRGLMPKLIVLFANDKCKVLHPKTRKLVCQLRMDQVNLWPMFGSRKDNDHIINTKRHGPCILSGDENGTAFSFAQRKTVDNVMFPYTGTWSCYVSVGDKVYLYSYKTVKVYSKDTLELLDTKPTMIMTPFSAFKLTDEVVVIMEEKWAVVVFHNLTKDSYVGVNFCTDGGRQFNIYDFGNYPQVTVDHHQQTISFGWDSDQLGIASKMATFKYSNFLL